MEIINKNINSIDSLYDFIEIIPDELYKLLTSNIKLVSMNNLSSYIKSNKIFTVRDELYYINCCLSTDVLGGFLFKHLRSDVINKFTKELPIYNMILHSLIAKITEVEYFFSDDIFSRKIVFTNPNECLSLVKIIFNETDYSVSIISFLRSSSNKMIQSDFAGLVFVINSIIHNPDLCIKNYFFGKIRNVYIKMIISDYHITEEV